MCGLRIRLFGRFSVKREGVSVPLDVAKTQELLAYLLLYRHQAHYREKLATLLWADSDPSRSRGYLRQTLWRLQTTLGEENDLLVVEADWIQISNGAEFWLDIDRFEAAAAATQGIHGNLLDAGQAAVLEDALYLYRADLLECWFHDWCVFERERLHNLYLALLEKLMEYFEAQGRYEESITYATRLLRCEPTHERTHRFLMRLHALRGDRTAALRAYERCATALREGLGVQPARRTAALLKQIQSDAFPGGVPLEPGGSLSSFLVRLEALEQTILNTQLQMTQEIAALRRALIER